MLSYRHGFHAGNFADVFKHAMLCLMVKSLLKKDKPFVYLDTHAGAGLYDLEGPLARKNREHVDGIARIWTAAEAPSALEPYLEAVRAYNPGGRLQTYPGSPGLVRHFLRPDDRMELSELHSSDGPRLRDALPPHRRLHIHQADGYQSLRALLPPKERRGLILCDPAYELKTERKKVVAAITDAWQRWPTGIYAIWHPIVDRAQADWFQREFKRSGIKSIWTADLRIYGEDRSDRLNGSGMLIINPPWQLDAQMETLGPWLAETLAQEGNGSYQQAWLVGE